MASINVERDLRNVYGWNYYTMNVMGIWPEEKKWNKLSSYKALMPIFFMLCFICVPQTTNLFFIWNDLNLVVENLSMGNITITISLLKTITFWLNGKAMKKLLDNMEMDWTAPMSKQQREAMQDIAKTTTSTIKRSTLSVQFVVFIYLVLRILTFESSGHRLMFRAYFPYNVDKSPNYELTLIGQSIGTAYAAITYTAVDTFVAMLVLHVCGQLSNLRRELKELWLPGDGEFRGRLGNIVMKHEYINRFAETIEVCFNMMLLVQMLGCTVQLCFQSFQAIMSLNGEINQFVIVQLLFLLTYIIYVLLQLYLYCYVGERLSVESTEVAYAAYDCEWYNLSASEAKLLVIIMRRASTPLRISAGTFCSFTLELYSQVLKTSLGYISVLYATTNE